MSQTDIRVIKVRVADLEHILHEKLRRYGQCRFYCCLASRLTDEEIGELVLNGNVRLMRFQNKNIQLLDDVQIGSEYVNDIFRRLGTPQNVVLCEKFENVLKIVQSISQLKYVIIHVAFDTSALRSGLYAYAAQRIRDEYSNVCRLAIPMACIQELFHYADTQRYKGRRSEQYNLDGFPKFQARECLYTLSTISSYSNLNVIFGNPVPREEVKDLDILAQVLEYSRTTSGLTIFVTGDYTLAVTSVVPTIYIPKQVLEIKCREDREDKHITYRVNTVNLSEILYSLLVTYGIIKLKWNEQIWWILYFSWRGIEPSDLYERHIAIALPEHEAKEIAMYLPGYTELSTTQIAKIANLQEI